MTIQNANVSARERVTFMILFQVRRKQGLFWSLFMGGFSVFFVVAFFGGWVLLLGGWGGGGGICKVSLGTDGRLVLVTASVKEFKTKNKNKKAKTLRQKETQSACAESPNKGVNPRSKDIKQTQQQRPESPSVTLTWHVSK